MTRLTPFAFLTGLHLAQLQFCYFFFLLINVTSTYVTYASIVISWMMGTLIGLIWQRLNPWFTVIAGLASYYAVRQVVLADPLAPYTLPLACLGVLVTGLWAGHFFVALFPAFRRADRLFLHENNGFLLGIITTFLGFTLGGRTFLLWAPLISGLITLAYLAWLKVAPTPEAARSAHVPDHASTTELRVLSHLVGWTLFVVPLLLALDSTLHDEPYYYAFEAESGILTFISSMLLVLVGLIALLNYHVDVALADDAKQRWRQLIWLVFAAGFVFLAIDERFEVHEFVRDHILKPSEIATDVSWVRPGDIVLHVYLLVGLVFTYFLFRELRRAPRAPWLFCAALALAAVIVVIDSLPDEYTESWPLGRFWTSAFEEPGELWVSFLFLLALLDVLRARIGTAANFALTSAAASMLKWMSVILIVTNVALPMLLYAYAQWDGQSYWRPFRADGTAVSWFSSLQLLLLAMLARLLYSTRARARHSSAGAPDLGWMWLVVAWTFVLFAFDERLDIHEAIRNSVLRPSDVFTEVDWLVAGDIVLYAFWIVGALVTPWLLRDLAHHRSAKPLFLIALALALAAIVIDSLAGDVAKQLPAWRFWDYVFEEVAELWAELLMLLVFARELSARLQRAPTPGETDTQDARDPVLGTASA